MNYVNLILDIKTFVYNWIRLNLQGLNRGLVCFVALNIKNDIQEFIR
jgi:hypothetical protein